MIASVRGAVTHLGPTSAVLDVGGIGLDVQCAPGTLAALRVGEPATLATVLVVREDSLTLFGFADADERTTFVILQSVTGIGPRLAQAMLAVHPPDALRRAVAAEDLTALMKVPGIGRKVAARLVLELGDKLGPPLGSVRTPGPDDPWAATAVDWKHQVHTGLVGLGWSARDADGAVSRIEDQAEKMVIDGDLNIGTLLRAALRQLSRT
ncbi:MAG TPA: Holliday junction branch migration protein RuvA [Actinopolymorphaceae bacterium]